MALQLTDNALDKVNSQAIQPNIILQIEGVDEIYSSTNVLDIIRVGNEIISGEEFEVGQIYNNLNQKKYVLLDQGTTTEIRQQLDISKGTSETVSSMRVSLMDKNQEITNLISPGNVVTDILARKAKVWMGFSDLVFPDDYQIVFSGIIDQVESKAGRIDINIAAPDSKKRGLCFAQATTKLTASMDGSQTSASVEDTSNFLSVYTGPGGGIDSDLTLYVRIDDEIMRYEGSTATSFTSLTRGAFATTNTTHAIDADVTSFYVISGSAIDLALKLMLSGKDGPYVAGVAVTSFGHIGHATLANTIYFNDINPEQLYGVREGDYITTTGATNGANNVSNKVISSIVEGASGWYLVIDGVSFVQEVNTTGTVGFRSQYDVWGPGAGLAMGNDEVDIAEHIDVQLKYLSSAEYRFYLKDTIENGLEFIGEQIYLPLASYSIPRKAKASIGFHSGPIPGLPIKTLDTSNVLNANELSLTRTINNNFYNTVIYKFDELPLEEKFVGGVITIDGTSVTQIPIGNRALIIESKGMRSDLSAVNSAQISSNRRLLKYKFGAETIKNLSVNFKTGYDLEIGDKVLLDMASLKLSDINSGTRSGEQRLFDITNKSLNVRNGQVKLELLDSNFNINVRYCLVAPASFVATGVSTTQFTIAPSFNTIRYGGSEYKKWEKFIGAGVVIRSEDYTTSDTSFIQSVVGNTITVSPALSFTPSTGYLMEFSDYDNQTTNVKLIYGFMSDGDNNFADGNPPYQMS